MLVPLTSSLYVDGTVTKPKEILLDIGTGYFVQVLMNMSLLQMILSSATAKLTQVLPATSKILFVNGMCLCRHQVIGGWTTASGKSIF